MKDEEFDRSIRRRARRAGDPPPFREEDVWRGVEESVSRRGAPGDIRGNRARGVPIAVSRRVAAACLAAMFIGGGFAGLELGRDLARRGPGAVAEPDVHVQRAGSAFVQAIESLSTANAPGVRDRGREAAVSALVGARSELDRLARGAEWAADDAPGYNVVRF